MDPGTHYDPSPLTSAKAQICEHIEAASKNEAQQIEVASEIEAPSQIESASQIYFTLQNEAL